MSGTSTSGGNGTIIVSGPDVIQVSDFYVHAGILHPIIIGSIAVLVLFGTLRLGSNRSIAPLTTFDWLVNVALGSTLAGIVNGNSLVRGLLALATMLGFQYATSILSTRFPDRWWCTALFQSPPLVIVFRGVVLERVMREHRVSRSDLYAALRQRNVVNVCLVECAIIEPNGSITVMTIKEVEEAEVEPDVLFSIPAYKALCESAGGGGGGGGGGGDDDLERNGIRGKVANGQNEPGRSGREALNLVASKKC